MTILDESITIYLEEYYLSDMNSRNGTIVNGRLLLPEEEYRLQEEDEVDFAQARYIFLK